jgi:hypothetical protein
MKIAQALKEHLEISKEKFVQSWEGETGFGSPTWCTNFNMDALMKEIDIFCETFKGKT